VEPDFKESHRKGVRRLFSLLSLLILIGGLGLRLGAFGRDGFLWEVARELGTFASVAVAVAFVYEHFIRSEERKLYLSDLEQLLKQYLPQKEKNLTVFEEGRPSLAQKLELIGSARTDVIECGIALRTFVSYFETRPATEFRNHVANLMRRGVRFRCLLLDPDCSFARDLADPPILERIRESIRYLTKLSTELCPSDAGGLQVLLYQSSPHFSMICVDGECEDGRLLVSPYLYGSRKAESPGFLIWKRSHPVLFEKFWSSTSFLLSQARPISEFASGTEIKGGMPSTDP
jgi:hypothetical protein